VLVPLQRVQEKTREGICAGGVEEHEHKMRTYIILGAQTKEEMSAVAEELCAWYRNKCRTVQDARRMEGWLTYWIQM
jgi:hypothetical protein